MSYKKFIPRAVILVAALLIFSCSFTKYAESDQIIISAKDALKKIETGYTAVDAQKTSSYEQEHLVGSVNIERKSITVKVPVANSLAPGSIVAEAAGIAGITKETDIIIYDDNKNMDSSRLYWTLKNYGHSGDILIVSGGLNEFKNVGAEITDISTTVKATTYKTDIFNNDSIIELNVIESMIDNPADGFKLIDVRSDEEFNTGTIPGAIHINHEDNFFTDLTFKTVQQIRIMYKENGIMPEDNIAMFCKSSVRAANTYVALYNAGYRNIKVYDGAWIEWTKMDMPIFVPETLAPVTIAEQDNS